MRDYQRFVDENLVKLWFQIVDDRAKVLDCFQGRIIIDSGGFQEKGVYFRIPLDLYIGFVRRLVELDLIDFFVQQDMIPNRHRIKEVGIRAEMARCCNFDYQRAKEMRAKMDSHLWKKCGIVLRIPVYSRDHIQRMLDLEPGVICVAARGRYYNRYIRSLCGSDMDYMCEQISLYAKCHPNLRVHRLGSSYDPVFFIKGVEHSLDSIVWRNMRLVLSGALLVLPVMVGNSVGIRLWDTFRCDEEVQSRIQPVRNPNPKCAYLSYIRNHNSKGSSGMSLSANSASNELREVIASELTKLIAMVPIRWDQLHKVYIDLTKSKGSQGVVRFFKTSLTRPRDTLFFWGLSDVVAFLVSTYFRGVSMANWTMYPFVSKVSYVRFWTLNMYPFIPNMVVTYFDVLRGLLNDYGVAHAVQLDHVHDLVLRGIASYKYLADVLGAKMRLKINPVRLTGVYDPVQLRVVTPTQCKGVNNEVLAQFSSNHRSGYL